MSKSNLILFEGPSKIDGKPIAVIATGIKSKSRNTKTGNLIQISIIRTDITPIDCILSGQDYSICGKCPHRYVNNNTCYVNVFKSIYNIYEAYKNHSYVHYNKALHLDLFKNKLIRFGAYGEPALLPINIVRDIISVCDKWTGYTHLWSNHGRYYKGIFMASVDNDNEAAQATEKGFKYFRVRPLGQRLKNRSERICLNESKNIQCEKCMLCNGNKCNIVITAHGRRAKHVK